MARKMILIGGGGHAKSCIDVIESTGEYEIEGILDLPSAAGSFVLNYPVIGSDTDIQRFTDAGHWFLVAIGQIKNPQPRIAAFRRLLDAGSLMATVVSPYAYISKHANIGEGTIVMHGARINAAAAIGRNCIINTNAVVEHDTTVGNDSHISTNATLNGGCKVGNRVFIGSNAVLTQEVHIADDVVVGAGTLVHRHIRTKGTYAGNPFIKLD